MQILIHQYSMNLATNKWQFYDLTKKCKRFVWFDQLIFGNSAKKAYSILPEQIPIFQLLPSHFPVTIFWFRALVWLQSNKNKMFH